MNTIAHTPANRPPPRADLPRPIRIGAVSYLNTLPLIEGLGKLRDAALTLTAPSRLIELLTEGAVDIALASVVDARRAAAPVAILPVGMIGCDGPTRTVRLFSRVPPERLRAVHADADSHTSVALLRVLLAERHAVTPEIIEFDATAPRAGLDPAGAPQAMLLIGDKVVTDPPPEDLYPHRLDLGEEWKSLTGLPFVYAVWMCRAHDADTPAVRTFAAVLDRQRRHNHTRRGWIAAARAEQRGWPGDEARRYLNDLLRYEVTPAARDAVERFFLLCEKHAVLPPAPPTRWADDPTG